MLFLAALITCAALSYFLGFLRGQSRVDYSQEDTKIRTMIRQVSDAYNSLPPEP